MTDDASRKFNALPPEQQTPENFNRALIDAGFDEDMIKQRDEDDKAFKDNLVLQGQLTDLSADIRGRRKTAAQAINMIASVKNFSPYWYSVWKSKFEADGRAVQTENREAARDAREARKIRKEDFAPRNKVVEGQIGLFFAQTPTMPDGTLGTFKQEVVENATAEAQTAWIQISRDILDQKVSEEEGVAKLRQIMSIKFNGLLNNPASFVTAGSSTITTTPSYLGKGARQ